MPGTLWMIPTTLGGRMAQAVLPAGTIERIHALDHFLVENPKSARAFLKSVEHPAPIASLQIEPLDNTTPRGDLERMVQSVADGKDAGILSEAGCPALADPGSNLARLAQERGLRVAPLTGPSSITLALIASGLETQRFTFLGYLPVKPPARDQAIHSLEARSARNRETQIFIETPYRNTAILEALLAACRPETLLCIASNLTMEDESVLTRPISAWRRARPSLEKKPCVFLVLAQFETARQKHPR